MFSWPNHSTSVIVTILYFYQYLLCRIIFLNYSSLFLSELDCSPSHNITFSRPYFQLIMNREMISLEMSALDSHGKITS